MPTIKWHIDCVFRARGTISTKPVSDQLQRERRALVRELSQHQVLLNILSESRAFATSSTISRLNPSHGSADCSKEEDAGKVLPGTAPNQVPYGGTEDINLTTEEERVDCEPPDAPPPPPRRVS
jgi:hypothetical protein